MHEQYVTYSEISKIDLLAHFASKYGVKKKVLRIFLEMCERYGPLGVSEFIASFTKVSYREAVYVHRSVALHNELLHLLRHGAKISEEGVLSRISKGDVLVEEVNGERRIRGAYRDLVFRRA